MASCITAQWANNVSPQVRLTVTINSAASTTTTAALDWVAEWVAHGYAADIGSRTWYGKVGSTDIGGTFAAAGITGTKTMGSGRVVVNRTNTAYNLEFSISFPFNMSWSGKPAETKSATGTISIPAITAYTITYDANGGTGTPASQTKTSGTDVKLTTAIPTRTGYTFLGWATSAGGNVAYAPGANYSTNANVTLYAIWTPTVYTITYNANGGTGAPAAQTKSYDVEITLSTTVPTRTNYRFKGWGVFASATTVSYDAGEKYVANESITLYAIWEVAYTKPRITDFKVSRCDVNGDVSDNGTYAIATFSWETDKPVTSIKITWSNGESTVTPSGSTSGTVTHRFGSNNFSIDGSYQIILIVTDTQSTTAYAMLRGATFIIDGLPRNEGVAFGKPAEMKGYAEFEFKAKFNSNVEGKVLGLAGVPPLDSGTNLNTVTKYGVYSIGSNDIAATISNIPIASAGTLRVYSATGAGVEGDPWDYLIQEYVTFTGVLWRRTLNNGSSDTYTPTDWFIPGGSVYITETGTSGIWTYRKWSDGKVELWGKYTISNLACTTALGSMYRTAAIVPTAFPFKLSNIYLTANYESDGYGAMLWATTQCTSTSPSNYYLIRPTSATISSGMIVMKVIAKLA